MSAYCSVLRLVRVIYCVLFLCGWVLFACNVVHAQSIDNAPSTTTVNVDSEKIDQFRQLLSEPDIQLWLQGVDQNSIEPQSTAPQFRQQLNSLIDRVRNRIDDLRDAAASLGDAPGIVASSWRSHLPTSVGLRVTIYIVIFLFVGAGFEWLYAQYTHYRLLELQLRTPDNLRERLTTALRRAMLTLGSLLAFAIGSIGTFLTFKWPEVVDDVVLNILIVVIVVRIATTLSRFFLSPRFEALRLVPFTSVQALSVHRWIAIIVSMGVINFAVSDVFRQLVTLSSSSVLESTALSVDALMNFVWLLVVLVAILALKKRFKTPVNESGFSSSTIWPAYLTLLAIAVFVFWILDTSELMWTILILGALFPVIVLCRNWVDNLFDQAEKVDKLHGVYAAESNLLAAETDIDLSVESESVEAIEAIEAATDDLHTYEVKKYERYRPIVRRLVRFVLVILAVIALVIAWNINLFALSSSQSFSGRIFEIAIDIIVAVLIADLIWVWAKSAIDRRLAEYEPPQDGQAPGPEARMATLLPLLRTILMTTLLIMVILSVLAAFGINIAPLLAGAGVVGVAIGFGTQALVRDVVSGIFFLVDDAFRVGEYIEIEGLRGTVETMSIRSLRIRHHRGAVHTIPFGELKALTNYSRDWVIMKLEFRVPFDTDLKLVKKLVKTIGAELQQNPDYGDSIIQPLKSQGVRRMEEFNMVVGVKFMAKPGEQWLIRRDAFQKVRDAFDANGILFAERNVKVEVLNAEKLDKEIEEAALGAAEQVITQPTAPGPIPDEP